MATDYIMRKNVAVLKTMFSSGKKSPEMKRVYLTCSTTHTAKPSPFHFHLHMGFASPFTLTPQMWKQ